MVLVKRKLKLKELSEKVDVLNVNLSISKQGKVKAIRFSTLDVICLALDCQPGDILEYLEEKITPFKLFNLDGHFSIEHIVSAMVSTGVQRTELSD